MLSAATNLLNFNVLIKKGHQQHVFSTQLKLNMSEMKKKEELEILYKYSEKCVDRFPQASSFFIRACFHSKKLNTKSLELLG